MKKAQTKKKTPAAKRKSKAKTEPEERSVGDFTPAVRCAHSKMVPVSTLQRHPRNPNTHPEAQIKLLANIIANTGFRAPIVVSTRSGYITKGHGRLDAAELLGLKYVPVDFQDYDSAEAEMADMVADNKIASLAEMDRAVLKEIMEELDTGAFDMLLTGFDMDGIEELMTAAFPPDGNTLEPIPPAEGYDDADESLRLIIVFSSEDEKAKVESILGIKMTKVVYTAQEILTKGE